MVVVVVMMACFIECGCGDDLDVLMLLRGTQVCVRVCDDDTLCSGSTQEASGNHTRPATSPVIKCVYVGE